jgi:hypothetical protein
MKVITTILFAILLTPSILLGAEANVKSSFAIKSSYKKVIDFIDENPNKMRVAAGIEVLQDFGDGKLKVRRNTPKGVFVWIMQEGVEEKNNVYRYNSKMVDAIEGGIEDSFTDIIVKANKDHAIVDINIKAIVNNGRVNNIDLNMELKKKVRKIENLLQSNLE